MIANKAHWHLVGGNFIETVLDDTQYKVFENYIFENYASPWGQVSVRFLFVRQWLFPMNERITYMLYTYVKTFSGENGSENLTSLRS